MLEIELKLELFPDDVRRLVKSKLFGEPAEIRHQHSTYFDTPTRELFEAGYTLRLRRSGDVTTQTVKATGPGASLFVRSEWETPVPGDVPILDHSNPLLNELGSAATRVKPLFEVSIERHVWNLEEKGSRIEAVVDQGLAFSRERQTPICEIELELKDGDPKDLFAVARRIGDRVPVKFGVQSKAERGYRLLAAQQSAIKAEPLKLPRSMSAVDAFEVIAHSCFRQFRLNEGILLRRENAEALHQARVALRRLRSAFSLFRPLLQDSQAPWLAEELRWLAGVLGDARNLDVLLPKAGNGELLDRLADARNATYQDVFKALATPRAAALMLAFNAWLHCGEYLAIPASRDIREAPATQFAVETLDKIRKKLKKHGQRLAAVDDAGRHQARKDAKKLRYAAEFFGSLFSGKRETRRYKRFISAMESLQDQLGTLNDSVSVPDILHQHGLLEHPEAKSVLSQTDKSSLIEAAQSALDDVLDAKRFWR